jgi:hypothetical protein
MITGIIGILATVILLLLSIPIITTSTNRRPSRELYANVPWDTALTSLSRSSALRTLASLSCRVGPEQAVRHTGNLKNDRTSRIKLVRAVTRFVKSDLPVRFLVCETVSRVLRFGITSSMSVTSGWRLLQCYQNGGKACRSHRELPLELFQLAKPRLLMHRFCMRHQVMWRASLAAMDDSRIEYNFLHDSVSYRELPLELFQLAKSLLKVGWHHRHQKVRLPRHPIPRLVLRGNASEHMCRLDDDEEGAYYYGGQSEHVSHNKQRWSRACM